MNEMEIYELNYLVKEYDGLTKLIAGTKQRLQSLPGEEERDDDFDTLLKGDKHGAGLETVKRRLVANLEKVLPLWAVWDEWLVNVPGIGPALGARLILLYYYRFIPVCKECGGGLEKKDGGFICTDCGKKSKGDGVLKHRIEMRDFPTISKWWAFMGRHTVDGAMPKRKAGQLSNWSTIGRTVGFHIGDQFNRQDEKTHPYKAFLQDEKKTYERTRPEWSKGHRHNAAKNNAVKLFLSHFWQVARTLDGKEVTEPYAGTILKHTGIMEPFYWEKERENCA